jgi:hypothetical protein
VRQGGAVDALRAEHVDVVLPDELVRREGLRRAEHHVPGVVDDGVQAPGLLSTRATPASAEASDCTSSSTARRSAPRSAAQAAASATRGALRPAVSRMEP